MGKVRYIEIEKIFTPSPDDRPTLDKKTLDAFMGIEDIKFINFLSKYPILAQEYKGSFIAVGIYDEDKVYVANQKGLRVVPRVYAHQFAKADLDRDFKTFKKVTEMEPVERKGYERIMEED
jgi:hypothetical protein